MEQEDYVELALEWCGSTKGIVYALLALVEAVTKQQKCAMINCVYSDIEKICIHPSKELFETGPMVCIPDKCNYQVTFEQAEEYVKPTHKETNV